MKGPWVSGPWLNSWGGNAKALFRPRLYTRVFRTFSPCGTMFRLNFFVAGHVAASRALDVSASNEVCQCGGLEVHLILIRSTCTKRSRQSRK